MIHLTRLNRTPLFLNSDLIEHLQSTPDTVITLTSGHNFMVLESPRGNHFPNRTVPASDHIRSCRPSDRCRLRRRRSDVDA